MKEGGRKSSWEAQNAIVLWKAFLKGAIIGAKNESEIQNINSCILN